MGTVYFAEQEKPLRRRVALNVIKAGMDTKSVIARFEAEWQTRAAIDHRNIAKVLDAGTTERGRPYFEMELVRGIAITEFGGWHLESALESPLTIQSDNSLQVSARWAATQFIKQTFHEYAGLSITKCEWAMAYYELQLSRGKSNK